VIYGYRTNDYCRNTVDRRFSGLYSSGVAGVPLSYTGIIVLQLTDKVQFSTGFLVIWAVIVIAVQALDYFIPAWGAKKFGGAKRAFMAASLE